MTTTTTQTQPSWLPWATFVATVILIHNRFISRRRHIVILATSSQKEEEEALPLSPEPFPWEPNNIKSTSDTTPPQQAKHHQKTNTPNTEEQLQFLACMTFANGGLRSPSCPCCQ